MEYAWDILVMVDAHIIATEYNIDPLTVMMCLNAPCKNNERSPSNSQSRRYKKY